MTSPGYISPTASSRTFSFRHSKVPSSITSDGFSDDRSLHVESARARHQDELQALAAAVNIPSSLPSPLLSSPDQRTVPQNMSDKAGAEAFLLSLRPKRFLLGKSAKGYADEEVLRGLERAVEQNQPLAVLEALLQFVESSATYGQNTAATFTQDKKGHAVPTLDYVFSKITSTAVMRLFLPRVSQRSRDNALARCLGAESPSVDAATALLEWGANPETCRDALLRMCADSQSEALLTAMLLSPALNNIELLSQALIQAADSASLQVWTMLLLRGADGCFSEGEALKRSLSKQRYAHALAVTLLSRRAVSSSVLDAAVGLVEGWSQDLKHPFMMMLLYAGAAGPRTSKAVASLLVARDQEIIAHAVTTVAFSHGSFPNDVLFKVAIDTGNMGLALDTLRLSKHRSFSLYAKTGVHLQLVEACKHYPNETLEVITEFLTLGVSGQTTSEMVARCCEPDMIHLATIPAIVELLIQTGLANANYANGRSVILAIEAASTAIVRQLMSARPTAKVLSQAVGHLDKVLDGNGAETLQILGMLVQAGARGDEINHQLVKAVSSTTNTTKKIELLLPVASVDYAGGDAIFEAIRRSNLSIFEKILATKRPETALLTIWDKTRRLFDIVGETRYEISYMLSVMTLLCQAGRYEAPLDDLLQDATQCPSEEAALALTTQLLEWGASPDLPLGVALTACVRRSDKRTLQVLLSCKPKKTTLRYAFEQALILRGSIRYEILKAILHAGPDASCLDTALPQLLKEDVYDEALVHMLIDHNARIHSSLEEYLVPIALQGDLQSIESLLPESENGPLVLPSLKAVLQARSDWEAPDGPSLPLIKLLLSKAGRGAWADQVFFNYVILLNEHAADIFVNHLTSAQILSNALASLLSDIGTDFTMAKLSMTRYLLERRASGVIIDEVFLKAAAALDREWMALLSQHLVNQNTTSTAFEVIRSRNPSANHRNSIAIEIEHWLLGQTVSTHAVNAAFVAAGQTMAVDDIHHLLPYVRDNTVFSVVLERLAQDGQLISTDNGMTILKLLIKHGASQESMETAIRVAARSHSIDAVQLIMSDSTQTGLCKAAFKGMLDSGGDLTSSTERAILRLLIKYGLDEEDLKRAAARAAEAHDTELLTDLAPTDGSIVLHNFGLSCLASQGLRWLSASGLVFLKHLLGVGVDVAAVPQMVELASRQRNMPALILLIENSRDRPATANIAFGQLTLGGDIRTLSDDLSVLEYLLLQGARGARVEKAAADAAESSNHVVLDIFLKSPAAASVIPSAFRAVARSKSTQLSCDQLSIASILLRHGVSTDILAVAAAEVTRQLDVEALEVLAKSPRFAAVTDDTARILLLSDDLWRSPQGLRILLRLFKIGVTSATMNVAALKAITAFDSDMLRTVLEADPSPGIVESAFIALTDLEQAWLSPEGIRLAQLLLQKDPPQAVLNKAFIQCCQYFYYEALQLLLPHVSQRSVISEAFSKATSSGTEWMEQLHVIEVLLAKGVKHDVVEDAFVQAAAALKYEAVRLLASDSMRGDVFSKGLSAALRNPGWRQYVDIIKLLLDHGANGQPVYNAFILATSSLDMRATRLLSGHVENSEIDTNAFNAMIANPSWLLPNNLELVKFMYQRQSSPDAQNEALSLAAQSLCAPCVTLLAQQATSTMASAAFARAVDSGNIFDSDDSVAVLTCLAKKGATGPAVDSIMVASAGNLRLDLIQAVYLNLTSIQSETLAAAFDMAVSTGDEWLHNPDAMHILRILITTDAVGECAPDALVNAAQAGNGAAVDMLMPLVNDRDVYARAFSAFVDSNTAWLQDDSLELLDQLLSHGASGEVLDEALVVAVQALVNDEASMELLSLLLTHGASVNFQDGKALQTAARHGRTDIISIITPCNPDGLALYMGLKAALCEAHDEELASELIQGITGSGSDVPPDVNHSSEHGVPLIFYALLHYGDSLDIAKHICQLGADLNTFVEWSVYKDDDDCEPKPDPDLISPLLFALLNDASDEVIEGALIANGADFNYVPEHSQTSALILAAKLDRYRVLKKLIDAGSKVAQTDCYDRSPLFYAARMGNTSAITSLIRRKAPVNDGSLHEAARELHPDSVKVLLAKGHAVDFPSLKHGGRNPLCELSYNCNPSQDTVRLHHTLQILMDAKSDPLRKYRGKPPLFYALENSDPVPIVSKLIELCLWQDLNDPGNVFEQDDHSYSATMYIKKGLYQQSEGPAYAVLQVLEDADAQDRYYAKERMKQPSDAIGMPQRIADLDRKKWIRSSRLDEEEEDHRRKLRRDAEEMSHRDQLTTNRHLLTMEHREDTALQLTVHKSDARWQDMQFRSLDHAQNMRYHDAQIDYKLDETTSSNRLKGVLDVQHRDAQLQHDHQTRSQKLTFQGQEQNMSLVSARDQQQLRLEGVSSENMLKSEQSMRDVQFKVMRSAIDQADMDAKRRHATDVNADKVSTQNRLEDIARDSQQRKITLDRAGRQDQLEHHVASDQRKLMTEGQLNQYRQENNNETIRTRTVLSELEREDRHDKLVAAREMDDQKLNTLRDKGEISNRSFHERNTLEQSHLQSKGEMEHYNLRETGRIANENLSRKGEIQNQTLYYKNELLQDNRANQVQTQHQLGQIKINTEQQTGQAKIATQHQLGQIKINTEQQTGRAKVATQQQMNGLNREKNSDNLNYNSRKNADNLNFQSQAANINARKNADNVHTAAQQARWKQAGRRR